MAFSPIPDVLADIAAGKMVIVVDDEGRENEGDLVMAAEKVTPDAINFMRKHGGGLICLPLTGEKCDRLKLELLPGEGPKNMCAFTISVGAKKGTTTGISAADRATTIRTAAREDCSPADLHRPGHVFPLRGRDGGVLVRAGHTEATIDLARLAGLAPAGVLCEIMNDDGTMARVPQLEQYAEKHGLKMCTIKDLIFYRRKQERLIQHLTAVRLPTKFGSFDLHCYRSDIDNYIHLALCLGGIKPGVTQEKPVLVRVHSECLTGDIFHSVRCDCGEQLEKAQEMIAEAGCGVVLYMRQEGRGIGLEGKLHAYKLQDDGLDTVEANEELGYDADERDYGVGAQILRDLGLARIRLLTNNPKKYTALAGYGIEIVERVAIEVEPGDANREYLKAKKDKLGHLLENV
ncbi:MAG: bifunctional 3,4-dihydroxy-2-butanone-4-phosphate synthase/GTP cyclohydrolase II [Planctomycetota bacterium]